MATFEQKEQTTEAFNTDANIEELREAADKMLGKLEDAEEIIKAGHPPIANKVILVDFDGTIGPFGHLFDFPAPLPGAKETLNELRAKGFKIGIFTSRLSKRWLATVNQKASMHRAYIKHYCRVYEIPCDFITAEKVPSEWYIDDKALPFGGHWDITRGFLGLKMESEK